MKVNRKSILQGHMFCPGDKIRHRVSGREYTVNEVSDSTANVSWDRLGPVVRMNPSYTLYDNESDTIRVISNWHVDEFEVYQGTAP